MVHDKLGPRLPAEFEPHRSTYLLWPIRPDNWRDGAKRAQAAVTSLANLLSRHEPVTIGTAPGSGPKDSQELDGAVRLVEMRYDDIWVRDTGPVIVLKPTGGGLAVDFRFNSWGGLFSSASNDDAVASAIASAEGCELISSDLVLEGGAIISDGLGTIIATEESILAENRNPGLMKSDVERKFRELLYADQVIWVSQGLAFDESGGHIDNVCAFANRHTILIANTDDRSHPSFGRLKEAQSILSSATNSYGQRYKVTLVPLPPETEITAEEANGFAAADGTIKRQKGTPLAPSHMNFYIANGVVIVPTFGCETDGLAVSIVESVFPERQVVGFPSREFLLGGGAVHCLAREIPKF